MDCHCIAPVVLALLGCFCLRSLASRSLTGKPATRLEALLQDPSGTARSLVLADTGRAGSWVQPKWRVFAGGDSWRSLPDLKRAKLKSDSLHS